MWKHKDNKVRLVFSTPGHTRDVSLDDYMILMLHNDLYHNWNTIETTCGGLSIATRDSTPTTDGAGDAPTNFPGYVLSLIHI